MCSLSVRCVFGMCSVRRVRQVRQVGVLVVWKIVVLLQHLTLNKRITRKPTEDLLSSVGLSGSCFKFSVRNYLKAEDIFYTACPPILAVFKLHLKAV